MGRVSDRLGTLPYIDANIVIYIVESFVAHERLIRTFAAALDSGEIAAVTSKLTLEVN